MQPESKTTVMFSTFLATVTLVINELMAANVGEVNARALIVFKHDSKLGNARSSQLFDLVKIEKVKDEKGKMIACPRQFEDYKVTVNGEDLSPCDYTKIRDGIAMKVLI